MARTRLDTSLVERGVVISRSQAESYIKLGLVQVNGELIMKPGFLVHDSDEVKLVAKEKYVSRAGLKLASVAKVLKLDFRHKVVLDVGSSTGGFTDYALQNGADKVIAVDVGTSQLHPILRNDSRVDLHEQTDIRDFVKTRISTHVDVVMIDVSFISLKDILPALTFFIESSAVVIAMVKPQFEAGHNLKHKGVIKNERMRRDILKGFEDWVKDLFFIIGKADSDISGAKGNRERFYLLRKLTASN